MIVGGPGSGKSYLSRRLAEISGLPVYHMDHIHWLPGWVERDPREKDLLARGIHAREQWIFEGGHSRTYDHRAAHADLLIWLDLPVGLRLRRVLWRSLRHHGRTRPDLPEGCPENFGRQTIDFLRFIWRTRETSRLRITRVVEARDPRLRVAHLQSAEAVSAFLKHCRPVTPAPGLSLPDRTPGL